MLPESYPHRKYMVYMLGNIIYWRWEEMSPVRDKRTNDERTITEDRATQPMEDGGWVSQCNWNITITQSQKHRCTEAWTQSQTDTHTPRQKDRHRNTLRIKKTLKETHRHAHTNKHIDTHKKNIWTNAQMHAVILVHMRMHCADTSQSHMLPLVGNGLFNGAVGRGGEVTPY